MKETYCNANGVCLWLVGNFIFFFPLWYNFQILAKERILLVEQSTSHAHTLPRCFLLRVRSASSPHGPGLALSRDLWSSPRCSHVTLGPGLSTLA